MPLVARAKPEKIKLEETYRLFTSPDYTVGLPENEREGEIKITIPYDGKTSVTRTTIDDLRAQISLEPLPQESVRIGHLGLRDHQGTDLDERYGLGLTHNLLPLNLHLSGEGLSLVDDLTADSVEQSLKFPYEPAEIKSSPIKLKAVVVTDEYDRRNKTGNAFVAALREQWKQEYQLRSRFDLALNIVFVFSFDVPRSLQPALANKTPKIVDMTVQWPVATSIDHVEVEVETDDEAVGAFDFENERRRNVKYDPREQTLHWGNIPFDAKEEENGRYSFTTPPIRLKIDKPGELYRQENLTGKLTVKFNNLFSGTGVAFFNASGVLDRDIKLETETKMQVDFSFMLQRRLEQRLYAPYQVLKFPRVILNQMRIDDVLSVLQDKRFRVDTYANEIPDGLNGKSAVVSSIFAARREGDDWLILIVDLEGRWFETMRTKRIPDGEKLQTVLPTGEMTCYVRGWFNRDPRLVVQEINDIHALLKYRFRHVRTLD